ncbi:MAG TPA: Fur family transcriptional regulator [Anaerolineales bacterium]|nr:Fur family transcriptional regulator [Anaerolineales bacterium]
MTDQIENLTTGLETRGYRLTAARRVIIESLVASGGHITADELASQVRQNSPTIGRMTVYRTLEILCEVGAIHPIYQGTGAARFILMPEGSHHHLICNRCHAVIEFEDCEAGQLAQVLSERFNFLVSGHLLELHGLCADCARS